MINIYLIRHAQSIGNIEKRLTGRTDYPLTLEGKKQAENLTQNLKNIKFFKIYSSPYQRTYNTVKQLAKLNHIKIIVDEKFSEMYFGVYDGFKWEEVNKENPHIHIKHMETNEIMNIPEQENTEQVAERMYKRISEIVQEKENKNKNILIASHGVAIEAFLRKITQEPFVEKREEYSQKNTSVNLIEYDESNKIFKVKILNNKMLDK